MQMSIVGLIEQFAVLMDNVVPIMSIAVLTNEYMYLDHIFHGEIRMIII